MKSETTEAAGKARLDPLVRVCLVWAWTCPHCKQHHTSGVMDIDRTCNLIRAPEGRYPCPACGKFYVLTENPNMAMADKKKE